MSSMWHLVFLEKRKKIDTFNDVYDNKYFGKYNSLKTFWKDAYAINDHKCQFHCLLFHYT